jgi:hypothetical protein
MLNFDYKSFSLCMGVIAKGVYGVDEYDFTKKEL